MENGISTNAYYFGRKTRPACGRHRRSVQLLLGGAAGFDTGAERNETSQRQTTGNRSRPQRPGSRLRLASNRCGNVINDTLDAIPIVVFYDSGFQTLTLTAALLTTVCYHLNAPTMQQLCVIERQIQSGRYVPESHQSVAGGPTTFAPFCSTRLLVCVD